MEAAGVKAPAPLDELESHLREEIERRLRGGADEQRAFEAAIAQIGHAASIQNEFRKVGDSKPKLAESATARRALGLLWLVYCLGNFYTLTNGLMSAMPVVKVTPLFVLAWLMDFVYLRGIIASVLWFGGVKRERSFILLLAILDAIGGTVVLTRQPFQPRVCFFTLLGFFTLWLLWPARKQKVIAPHV